MNKYYKVVRELGGYRFSCAASGKARVEYSDMYFSTPPEWLKKEGYGLCVFNSLRRARTFVNSLPPYSWECIEIWEVEVKDKLPKAYFCALTLLKKGTFVPICFNWPVGTRMFGRVKLTRCVLRKYYDDILGAYIIKEVK